MAMSKELIMLHKQNLLFKHTALCKCFRQLLRNAVAKVAMFSKQFTLVFVLYRIFTVFFNWDKNILP